MNNKSCRGKEEVAQNSDVVNVEALIKGDIVFFHFGGSLNKGKYLGGGLVKMCGLNIYADLKIREWFFIRHSFWFKLKTWFFPS